ncbi:LPS-assembly protein LptD [Candidatus Omnitrophota bacterium]
MRLKGIFFIVLMFTACFIRQDPGFSQDTDLAVAGEPDQGEKQPIVCEGDQVEFLENQQRLEATGNVLVIYEDLRITCDQISIAVDTKDGVATGDVVVYQKDTILTADKFEYNFDTQKGQLYQGKFASEAIYGHGPKAIKEGPDIITMPHSYMTTCDLAKPHYRIHSRTAKIYLEDKVVMRHVIVYMFDLPAFYLPYYSYSLKPERAKVSLLPGKDKDWGFYLLTAWRYELNQYLKGILRLDYRERKDFASGFENYYTSDQFGSGFIKTYYMNERDLESKNLWKDPRITHERERYMIHQRHSWDIDQDTDLELEYWNLSDTTMLKDYFYREDFRRQPQPLSFVSVIRTQPRYTVSLLAQRRFNKIFQRLEYQPELELNIPNLQIGPSSSRFYWRSDNSFANISRKLAHPSDIDQDTVRFDSYNQIKRISKLAFLNITPYVGGRQTYYTKDRYGEGDWWRGALYTGVDVETKFYRIFNVNINKWDLAINNLRHVITPNVGYHYQHTPTILPEKLVQFDALDAINRRDEFVLSLENKLQTKRGDQPVDLARLMISTNYLHRRPGGSRFTNVNFDFEFTPFSWLTLEFDTSYDHRQDRFTTYNLDIYADQDDDWLCGFGYRYAHEDHSEATFELSFKPTPLWKIGIYERFMFKGYPNAIKKIYDLREQEYRITRDLHCWTSEILYTISRGEGESVYLVFRLKAFPEMPLEFGKSYHAPKPGSQNPIR